MMNILIKTLFCDVQGCFYWIYSSAVNTMFKTLFVTGESRPGWNSPSTYYSLAIGANNNTATVWIALNVSPHQIKN